MKAVVAAFNQEKALVGAFSMLTNLRMELFQALAEMPHLSGCSWGTHAAGNKIILYNLGRKKQAQMLSYQCNLVKLGIQMAQ